jgi:hypothetical protein
MHDEHKNRSGPTPNEEHSAGLPKQAQPPLPGDSQLPEDAQRRLPEDAQRRLAAAPVVDCAACEAMMADVLDGQAAEVECFRLHLETCSGCRSIFHEVEDGLSWMNSLAEVEPPPEMVHRILTATIGSEPMPAPAAKKSLFDHLREWPPLQPVFGSRAWATFAGTVLEPRFAMSFGMAFFSIMLILTMFGIKLASLRKIDLRPAAVVRTYYETQGKVVKYYENIRFVLELESTMRDLKHAAAPENAPKPSNDQDQSKKNHDTSRAPSKPDNQSRAESSANIAGIAEPVQSNLALVSPRHAQDWRAMGTPSTEPSDRGDRP